MKPDLNCDLGEGEPIARTRALMRCITSANVACGGHAGDIASMTRCVRLAKQFGVKLGAHPGPWSRGDFGRGAVQLTPDEFELLLLQQVGALEAIARAHGVALHHIKLHGALYHASEAEPALRRRYLDCVRRFWPGVRIYALAGGAVCREARRASVTAWPEAFADRAYRADGTLVPRGEAGAVLPNLGYALEHAGRLLGGRVLTATGQNIRVTARTLCIHSDTPFATRLASVLAKLA